jgi:DGQHR domain-containing protein
MTPQDTVFGRPGTAPGATGQLSGCLVVQRGTLMLQTASGAQHVATDARPDIFDPNTRTGYQRLPNQARMRRLAEYYRRGGKMPNPLLCNVRRVDMDRVYIEIHGGREQRQRFEEAVAHGSNWIGMATVTWTGDLTLWIMDGQHRGGSGKILLDDLSYSDFPINLTITIGLTREEETEEFYEVNSNQVNVATDLAQELLTALAKENPQIRQILEETGKSWIVQGDAVFKALESKPGPWQGRFLGANERKHRGDGKTLTGAQFVRSLKPVLDMPLFQQFDPDTAATIINAYWLGICAVIAEPFGEPDNYVIQKGPGAVALHRLLPQVIEVIRSRNGRLGDPTMYAEVMKDLPTVGGPNIDQQMVTGAEFWRVGSVASGFGGDSGRRRLGLLIQGILPKPSVDITV